MAKMKKPVKKAAVQKQSITDMAMPKKMPPFPLKKKK